MAVVYPSVSPTVCLSVSPSVCPMPDPKSRTEDSRKLNIGRKEAHATGDHSH